MNEPVSKQRRAYCRKLVLAHMIATERHDLLSLEAATGMPRRTLQDTLRTLADIGIECAFIQDGPRHRHGHYQINAWADHDPAWIAAHINELRRDVQG